MEPRFSDPWGLKKYLLPASIPRTSGLIDSWKSSLGDANVQQLRESGEEKALRSHRPGIIAAEVPSQVAVAA